MDIRRKGFTLVELVIVVAVLAILAAVAVPVYQDFITPTKKSAGRSAVEGVRSGIKLFKLKKVTDTGTATLPTLAELTTKGTVLESGVPDNPYSTLANKATVEDADAAGKTLGQVKAAGSSAAGWYYRPSNGDFWAATDSGAGEAAW